MPGALETTGRAVRKSRHRRPIVKPDPDGPDVSETAGGARAEDSEEDSSECYASTRNLEGQSLARLGRSNARKSNPPCFL